MIRYWLMAMRHGMSFGVCLEKSYNDFAENAREIQIRHIDVLMCLGNSSMSQIGKRVQFFEGVFE